MSTATLDLTNVLSTKVTYVRVIEGEGENAKVKVFPESEELDQKIAEGEYTEQGRQTFNFPDPQNWDGFLAIVQDDEERFNLSSRGLMTKLQNKARTTVQAKDFQATEEVIDLTEYAGQKSERIRLSPTEKLLKSAQEVLGGMSAEDRQKLLAAISAMSAV